MTAQAPNYVYLDTSAYLAIILGEKDGPRLHKLLLRQKLCSSVFLFLEAQRNLVRLSREKILSSRDYAACMGRLKEDVERFALRDFTFDLAFDSSFPAVQIPRSADLVHLRTALWFREQELLKGFLSLDKWLNDAAADLGLNLL